MKSPYAPEAGEGNIAFCTGTNTNVSVQKSDVTDNAGGIKSACELLRWLEACDHETNELEYCRIRTLRDDLAEASAAPKA
jgi:hypothetical protein